MHVRRAGSADPIEGSALRYAIDTGEPFVTVVKSDPLIGPGGSSIAAVPVVAEGRVMGVLAVWRDAAEPFGPETCDILEVFAPNTAAALTSADRHGFVSHQARVDGLTALGNRRRLDDDLANVVGHAVAADTPVAFAMLDIDHFKNYNDTHGHGAGDEALQLVGQIIARCVRGSDVVYRYGGAASTRVYTTSGLLGA